MISSKGIILFTIAYLMLCLAVVFGQSTSGAMRDVTNNSSGYYRVTGVAPGRYDVEGAAQGFATETHSNVELTVAEEIVVNFNLKVRVDNENVTVEVQSVNVETTGSTISGLVDEKKIRGLPLDGRDITQLIFLQPGIVESRGSAQTSNTGRGSRFSVAGARPSQNLFQIDGTTINDALNNTPGSAQGLLLGVETIKEFRVLTNTFSAEYGRVAGGVLVAVTKSGSNDFHGSAFEFFRNDKLDARRFFDRCPNVNSNCDGGGKPEFRRNQFGGAIGGPIIKSKTFFFGSYEGLRELKGISLPALVPDDNARRGIVPGRNLTTVDPRAATLLRRGVQSSQSRQLRSAFQFRRWLAGLIVLSYDELCSGEFYAAFNGGENQQHYWKRS